MAAAVLTALVAAGLAWWLGQAPDRRLTGAPDAPPPAAAAVDLRPAFAAATPEPEQVRRAYDQVRDVYADGGAAAVGRFLADCAASVRADPRVLDFCLAADVYGAALGAPATLSAQDRLALAQSALAPGADAAGRVAAVRRLTGLPERARPAAAPNRRPPAHAAKVRRTASSTSACRFKSTPAARAACANPALRAAERRMQAAYNQALAAGANRRRLARDQARWQVQLNAASDSPRRAAAIYERRTRELRALARRE